MQLTSDFSIKIIPLAPNWVSEYSMSFERFYRSRDLIAMSEWCYLKKNEIQHANGFVLTLLSGDWSSPADLSPSSPKHLSPADSARLLREGLAYASVNSFSQMTPSSPSAVPSAPRRKKVPGSNTLTLRKKETNTVSV